MSQSCGIFQTEKMEGLTVSLSERGQECLIVEGYRYTKQYIFKCGKVKWLCDSRRRTRCQAKCITEGDPLVVTEHDFNHNHENDELKCAKKSISNSCKRKAEDDLYSKPCKILKEEIASCNNKEVLTEKDICNMRKVMWNARKKTLPPLPKNVEETLEQLDELSLKTDRNEQFLLENDHNKKIVIFGCKTNVDELKTATTVLMDGTFEYCCKFFKQLFTIFIVKNGHYVPVLFCLLPDKKESTYDCLFQKIKIMINNDFLTEIMVDFEIAIHNAIKRSWPGANIFGCRFHLTQSWFRKIQNLGLATVYRSPNLDNEEEQVASKWLHGIFGIPFLSPEDVGESFVEDFMAVIPQGQKFSKFADYLVENYIEDEAKFPPKMWASFCKNHVTTNPCESFHSHFQTNFYHAHPDVFSFTKQLISFQIMVYVKINSINDPPRPPGSKFKRSQQKLDDAKQMFLFGTLSRKDFVIAASRRYAKR